MIHPSYICRGDPRAVGASTPQPAGSSAMTRTARPFSDLPKHLRKVCQQKVLAFLHGHLMPTEAGYDAKNCELDDRNGETVWVCYEKPCTPKAVAY